MKISRSLKIVATFILLELGQAIGQAQIETYSYSGPLGGNVEVALTPGPGYVNGFVADFGTISETLTYNPVAQTLQEKGSVTLSPPASGSFNIYDSLQLNTVVGSATLTVGNNGSFSFDSLFSNDSPFGSSLPFLGTELLVPVSGTGTDNGQAFAGNWNIQLPLTIDIISASPTSLTFSQYGNNGLGRLSEAPSQGVVQVPGLINGLQDGSDDDNYFYEWDQDSIVATALPEPGTMIVDAMMLLPFGAGTMRMLRKRKTL
jgi:hypothetical protein